MIIFCLAGVRSGTTAIARCFQASSAFVNLGEIFYNAADGMGDYVKRWEHPDPPSISRFEEYLNFLRADKEHDYWLDVKFHDLSRFNPLQFMVTAPPVLLHLILNSGDPTVLIGRANPLRAAVSGVQAQMTGIFHLMHHEALPENDTAEPCRSPDQAHTIKAIRNALEMQSDLEFVEAQLRSHRNLFRVDYEALFSCSDAPLNRAALGAWIGVEAVSQPDLRKVSEDWPDWFDRGLAASVLQGTGRQWWLS